MVIQEPERAKLTRRSAGAMAMAWTSKLARHVVGPLVLCGLLAWAGPTVAQTSGPARDLPADNASPVDAEQVLQRAVREYGYAAQAGYQSCVTRLTALPEPRPAAAEFLLALAHGQLALSAERDARPTGAAGADSAKPRQAVAEHYRAMREALDRLLAMPEQNAYAEVLGLINGVNWMKRASWEPGQWQAFLENADRVLAEYSGLPGISPESLLRARFFRAVVTYRLALEAPRGGDEPQQEASGGLNRLRQAAAMFEDLTVAASGGAAAPGPDSASPAGEPVDLRWSGYANFYLSLIRYRQGRFRDAQSLLDLAVQQNQDMHEATVSQLREQIADALATAYAQDLAVTWKAGLDYDSNVILLGEHTRAPRDIGRRRDVAVGTGVRVDYRLDLGLLSKDLERWTIALSGRSSANWHADIDEYNEQDHGGSAAVQYRLLDQQGGQGPLYLTVQYDYDYFLLGNDGFLRNHMVSPRLTWYAQDTRSETSLGFQYSDRNYLEPLYDLRLNRDGNYFDFDLTESYKLLEMAALYGDKAWGLSGDPQAGNADHERWLRPWIGVGSGWDSTLGSEFDCWHALLRAGADVPLPYGVMLDLFGEWEWEEYNGGSLMDFHRRGREDLVQRYGIGAERRFVLVPGIPTNRNTLQVDRVVLVVRGDMRFTEDDSNVKDRLGQALFSYDRAQYGLSVALQLN